jgi:2-oxoisovalerate dehydrogenase E1 component beta subunit
VPEEEYLVPIGPARIAREGDDLTVYAYGMMAHYAALAADIVRQQDGIHAEVVDLRTLLPLDRETVLASYRKTGKALIVYEDNLTGGFGAEIAALLAEHAFEYMDAPIRRLAGPRRARCALCAQHAGVLYAQPTENCRRHPRAGCLLGGRHGHPDHHAPAG